MKDTSSMLSDDEYVFGLPDSEYYDEDEKEKAKKKSNSRCAKFMRENHNGILDHRGDPIQENTDEIEKFMDKKMEMRIDSRMVICLNQLITNALTFCRILKYTKSIIAGEGMAIMTHNMTPKEISIYTLSYDLLIDLLSTLLHGGAH